jgi:fructan beta-fructosidase
VTQVAYAQNNATTYNEPFRPQFHFTPAAHWMNDPNGLVYYNGTYHLFYQYYPNDIVWGPMHWGHATSNDLLNWTHQPIALYPDTLGMIFSGSAVIDKNNTSGFGKNAMVAIFTLHNNAIWERGFKNTESQGIAYSNDEGKTWTKYSGNPVLNNQGQQDFRDPKVIWMEKVNAWIMALAVGDQIHFYSSPNLKNWKFESSFKPANDLAGLGVWECPDLFNIKDNNGNDKWVLIINHGDKTPNGGSGTRYFVGNFDGHQFTNEQGSLWMDAGPDFYAAVTYSNVPDDKRILLGWMSNWQYAQKVPTQAWRSALTLPRELTLIKKEGKYFLQQEIVKQFSAIVKQELKTKSLFLPYEQKGINLSQSMVDIDFTEGSKSWTIELSNEKGERFIIDFENGVISTNRTFSGKIDFNENFANKKFVLPTEFDQILNAKLILDKASVEMLFNNGKYSMTNIFFPSQPYSIIKVSSSTIGAKIKSLTYSTIKKTW